MPTRKKRHGKKGTSKKIYKQVGCAKRMRQKGGSAFGAPVLFSRTMYPYDTTGGAANPMDARQTMTGGSKRKRYSRKYYKQSGGAPYSFLVGPANYADQPINEKYTETNQFRI